MRIVVLASSLVALPCLDYLQQEHLLAGLMCPDRQTEENAALENWARLKEVTFSKITKADAELTLGAQITAVAPDLVLVYTFPYKIPARVLTVVKHGFVNIHFSLLPRYKGPAPIFWQIRNGERAGGITIHQIEAEIDSGPVVQQQEVPIAPGETAGIYQCRLSFIAVEVLQQMLSDLKQQQVLKVKSQSEGPESLYARRPGLTDLKIDWEMQTADEIENLVNAANPHYGGAVCLLNGQQVALLEVSPATVPNTTATIPGTVIYADGNYGIFVLCRNYEVLRINILKTSQGILTGFKAGSLGIKAGDQFKTAVLPLHDKII